MNNIIKWTSVALMSIATFSAIYVALRKEEREAYFKKIEAELSDLLVNSVHDYRSGPEHRKVVQRLRKDKTISTDDFIIRCQLDIALNVLPKVEDVVESYRGRFSEEDFARLVVNLQNFVRRIISK